MVADRWLVHLEEAAVGADRQHVLQRLQRRPAAPGASRAAVVRGHRVVLTLELPDHLADVLDPRLDVRVDTQATERCWHHLEVAAGAGHRRQVGVAARFLNQHCTRQVEVDAVPLRETPEVGLDGHRLPKHPEELRRELVEGEEGAAVARFRVCRRGSVRRCRRGDWGGPPRSCDHEPQEHRHGAPDRNPAHPYRHHVLRASPRLPCPKSDARAVPTFGMSRVCWEAAILPCARDARQRGGAAQAQLPPSAPPPD